nr:hypothetical protein [Paraburkholderia sp. J67]
MIGKLALVARGSQREHHALRDARGRRTSLWRRLESASENRLTYGQLSGHVSEKTFAFAAEIGLKLLTTLVCSPAESVVKTMKRDYVTFMPKPDARWLRAISISPSSIETNSVHKAP